MLWQLLTWAGCLKGTVFRHFFSFLNKNLSSELPYKRGELISWEAHKMQRAHYALGIKISSLARYCILIGFPSNKSNKPSKGGEGRTLLFLCRPCSWWDLCRSFLLVTPVPVEHLTHSAEEETTPISAGACSLPPLSWGTEPAEILLINKKRAGYVLLMSTHLLFQTCNILTLLLLGKLLKQTLLTKGMPWGHWDSWALMLSRWTARKTALPVPAPTQVCAALPAYGTSTVCPTAVQRMSLTNTVFLHQAPKTERLGCPSNSSPAPDSSKTKRFRVWCQLCAVKGLCRRDLHSWLGRETPRKKVHWW